MKATSSYVATIAVLGLAVSTTCVLGHGMMTYPTPRMITKTYRNDCYAGLKHAGDGDLLMDSLENLSQKKQADLPSPATFDVNNGCRGVTYEPGQPITELDYDKEITVSYNIQGKAPGSMELSIVKPVGDGKDNKPIMYKNEAMLKRLDGFGNEEGTFTTTVVIQGDWRGCEEPGKCAIRFHWRSEEANETFDTCADIKMTPKPTDKPSVAELVAEVMTAVEVLVPDVKKDDDDDRSVGRVMDRDINQMQ